MNTPINDEKPCVYAKNEIIQPANSEVGHPAFLLARKGEELRIVRDLSKQRNKEYPIHVMNTLGEDFWVKEEEITYEN